MFSIFITIIAVLYNEKDLYNKKIYIKKFNRRVPEY